MPGRCSGRRWLTSIAVVAGLVGCHAKPAELEAPSPGRTAATLAPARPIDPPAGPGALAPNLTVDRGELLLSWLEPVEETGRHRLLLSRLEPEGWGEPVVVTEGSGFFANWADIPKVTAAGAGALVAHWLAKTAEETYAYSIFLTRSDDGGATWRPLGKLNADDTPTEHGFVSYALSAEGVRAFWVDGRGMVDGGPMALRTAPVGHGTGEEEVLDRRICECCSTDAAAGPDGPLVVYRDRSAEEVRDISVVRWDQDGWSEPTAVADDGWKIHGCPVNGPEIEVDGTRVAVAWFTGGGEQPRVQLAISEDGGRSFEPPMVVDDAAPVGRVDLAVDSGGDFWVSWLGAGDGRALVRLERFPQSAERDGESWIVAETDAGRAAGVPKLEILGDSLYVAWIDVGEGLTPTLKASAIRLPG